MIAHVLEQRSLGFKLPLARMCELLGIARATIYRKLHPAPPDPVEAQLRQRIRRAASASVQAGYRVITKTLRREGLVVNHKRVFRIMGDLKLLCRRKKRFVVTTRSDHDLLVYENLVRQHVPSRPDEIWVADITYIRLRREFIYLAVVLDAFSRRVIGWSLGSKLDTRLTLGALTQALQKRRPEPGFIHHSDRGIQYASQAYTDLLLEHGARVSMSRPGNPYDNAKAERFMRTLKYEEVHVNDYDNLQEAHRNIRRFINYVYNHKRLHSALGYRPPAEFEQDYKSINTNTP